MWKGPKEFLHYSRKQRNGIFLLTAAVLILWFFLFFDDHFYFSADEEDFTEFHMAVREWERKDSMRRMAFVNDLFLFDPNTLDDSLFFKLGLQDDQVQTIINYRKKGGKFYNPQDLKKIYGIDSLWFYYAEPFIYIKELQPRSNDFNATPKKNFRDFNPNTISIEELTAMGLYPWQSKMVFNYRTKVKEFTNPKEFYKVYGLDSALVKELIPYIKIDSIKVDTDNKEVDKTVELVDLNLADSVQLLSLHGIGPVFANRIVKYREILGGFYSKEQLLEIYGMDKERYLGIQEQLIVGEIELKKININTATFKELLKHPYLEYEQVVNIVNFRDKVRPFKNIEELKNIELVDELLFSKIAKYLKV